MSPRAAVAAGVCLCLLGAAGGVAAQGTWLHTACLAAAGLPAAAGSGTAAPGNAASSPPGLKTDAAPAPRTASTTAPASAAYPCKASPAWGQTGLDHVVALAAAAGPGNLGISLVKTQTLPAANAARAQLSSVMLAYLDGDVPLTAYRWFGPVGANPQTATKTTAASTAALGAGATSPTASVTTSTSPGALAVAPANPALLNPVQSTWRLGALGNEPQARSASWWLAAPYLGAPGPAAPIAVVATGADQRYTVLNFLAAQCPQLEGKVAPNAWTRCTTREAPEPASWALAALALALAAAAGRFARPQ